MNGIDTRELDELLSTHGARLAMGYIADRYRWAYSADGLPRGVEYDHFSQPSGLRVVLEWTNGTLTSVQRGTKVSALEARGDAYSEPELLKIAAMFLSDPE